MYAAGEASRRAERHPSTGEAGLHGCHDWLRGYGLRGGHFRGDHVCLLHYAQGENERELQVLYLVAIKSTAAHWRQPCCGSWCLHVAFFFGGTAMWRRVSRGEEEARFCFLRERMLYRCLKVE